MMQRLAIPFLLLALLGIGGLAAYFLTKTSKEALVPMVQTEDGTPRSLEGLSIYTSGEYGFSILYPAKAAVAFAFSPEHRMGTHWRRGALPNATGAPIVSIVPYEVKRETGYPRHFATVVHVGASNDPQELARCEEADESMGESAYPKREINGHTWSVVTFEDAATMQYVSGVSYRTVHEGNCIALGIAKTGSSYRDAPTEGDIPETTLEAAFGELDPIVTTFSFARP